MNSFSEQNCVNELDNTPLSSINDVIIQSNESEKKSVGSGKGSKKKESITKFKTRPQSSRPIQKPPEDNLMNLEWMNSAKVPPVFKNNKDEKQQKPIIKFEKKISIDDFKMGKFYITI